MKKNKWILIYIMLVIGSVSADILLGGPYISPFLTLLLCVYLIKLNAESKKDKIDDSYSPYDNWYNLSNSETLDRYLDSLNIKEINHALTVLIRPEVPESYLSSGERYPFSAVKDEIAVRLDHMIRRIDLAGKAGNSEVLVIFRAIEGRLPAGNLARRLVRKLSEDFRYKGKEFPVNINLGLTHIQKQDRAMDLVARCRTALSDSVDLGVNTFVISGMRDNDSLNRSTMLEIALRNAIENDEMDVFLQPKCSAGTGELVSMEALVRWTHPRLGNIPPEEFIPIAEDIGLIGSISRFVYYKAFEMMEKLDAIGYYHLRLALNISPVEIHDGTLIKNLTNGLLLTGADPHRVDLELTEGSLLINSQCARTILREVKNLGFQISIDDFGTGYSTFGYLKNFEFSTLKIDKSFIDHIQRDSNSRAIVQAIIALSRTLKLHTVAEGVETLEQYEILRQLGCDELQGYYFGRPMKFDDFLLYLKESEKLSLSILPGMKEEELTVD